MLSLFAFWVGRRLTGEETRGRWVGGEASSKKETLGSKFRNAQSSIGESLLDAQSRDVGLYKLARLDKRLG